MRRRRELRVVGLILRRRGDRRVPPGERVMIGGIIRLGGRAAAVCWRVALFHALRLQCRAAVLERDRIGRDPVRVEVQFIIIVNVRAVAVCIVILRPAGIRRPVTVKNVVFSCGYRNSGHRVADGAGFRAVAAGAALFIKGYRTFCEIGSRAGVVLSVVEITAAVITFCTSGTAAFI